jgi:hypothetical protein
MGWYYLKGIISRGSRGRGIIWRVSFPGDREEGVLSEEYLFQGIERKGYRLKGIISRGSRGRGIIWRVSFPGDRGEGVSSEEYHFQGIERKGYHLKGIISWGSRGRCIIWRISFTEDREEGVSSEGWACHLEVRVSYWRSYFLKEEDIPWREGMTTKGEDASRRSEYHLLGGQYQ